MTPSNKTTRTSDRRLKAGGGFTLIELLVVIFILGILVTLVVGVAQYVYTKAARKQTQATQAIVMSAIEAYHDICEGADEGETYPSGDIAEMLECLKGEKALANDAQKARIKRDCAEILLKLPVDAYSAENPSEIRDGFGKNMRYEQEGGLAGRPVLISAGPDGNFDTEDDNIRSDEY